MRKLLLFILSLLPASFAMGQVVSAPNAYELPSPRGIDHVFVFANMDDACIKILDGNVDKIYPMQGRDSLPALLDSGMDEWCQADAATGYILHTTTGKRTTFFVIDYSKYAISMSAVNPDENYQDKCSFTHLFLAGDYPSLEYQNSLGQTVKVEREAYIRYTSLGWDGEQWQDSVCCDTVKLEPSVVVGAPLRNTEFVVVYNDDDISRKLGLTPDSIESGEYRACAVAAHPTTITTVRGTEAENLRSNEVERPVEATQLTGSAPLEIVFKANGNVPVAQSYQWQIMKGNDLVVQRNDEQHRYTFDEYGQYRVLLWVSNELCRTDSMVIDVSVSTSQLLVPNVFTPNGDGQNDEFRVMYRSIVEFHCWIYNRWGHLVYEFTDPAKGWDGNIGGSPAAEGAYFYVIRAKGADAEGGNYTNRFDYNNKKAKGELIGIYQLSGDINLIRGTKK